MSIMKKSDFHISVVGRNHQIDSEWVNELNTIRKSLGGDAIGGPASPHEHNPSALVLIDQKRKGWQDWVKDFDRNEKSLVLVIEDHDFVPTKKDLALVDDILVAPFRAGELLSLCKHHQERMLISKASQEIQHAEEQMAYANESLERILKAHTPRRFTGIKGIHVMSKHLSGLKPGGDYFDIFESNKKDFINLLLVDSSNYGISSAVLGMILSSSAKLASDHHLSTSDWVRAIYREIQVTLGDSGHFSVFFGRINRKDFSLHYQLFGSIETFVVDAQGLSARLEKSGDILKQDTELQTTSEKVIQLNPKDRLVMLSDGFVSGVGGEHALMQVFNQKLNQEPFALVNELTYLIKSKLKPGETFPGEDCSAIVLDIEHRVLRLAPTG